MWFARHLSDRIECGLVAPNPAPCRIDAYMYVSDISFDHPCSDRLIADDDGPHMDDVREIREQILFYGNLYGKMRLRQNDPVDLTVRKHWRREKKLSLLLPYCLNFFANLPVSTATRERSQRTSFAMKILKSCLRLRLTEEIICKD